MPRIVGIVREIDRNEQHIHILRVRDKIALILDAFGGGL